MNKLISITALLLSVYIPYSLSQEKKESWTTATLSHGEWTPPADADWGPKRLALIDETSKELNNLSVRYKNEGHKITVSITGLSSITSVDIPQNGKCGRIKIPNGFINISLGRSWSDNYISIERSIKVPKEKPYAIFGEPWPQQQFVTLTKRDYASLGIPMTLLINTGQPKERHVFDWNIQSVSAYKKDDAIIITFIIDPKALSDREFLRVYKAQWARLPDEQDNSHGWS
jgi:hypothetical protein